MRRPQRWILASAAAVLALGGARWVWWVRQPLSTRAGDACEAMVRGDAKALFAYASAREIREEELTPAKLQAVLDRLIRPQIAQEVGKDEKEDDTGDFHALYQRKVVTPNGRQTEVGLDLWSGEHGLETNVLGSVLRNSWQLRFEPAKGSVKLYDAFATGVRGVQEDAAFLVSVGLRGVTSKDPLKPFSTWQQVETRDRALMAQYASESPPGQSG